MRYVLFSYLLGFFGLLSFNQPVAFMVQGTVKDEYNKAISGITIKEKNTSRAVSTDLNGSFSITVSSEKAVLVFYGVGFDTKEVAVKGNANLSVSLAFSTKALQEVVVTGYGVARKKDITGSVAAKTPGYTGRAAPVYTPLQGSVPGLQRNENKSAWYREKEKKKRTAGDRDDTDYNTEDYDGIIENRFLTVQENALSTFSIDVDAASYSNVRRFLQSGQLPPAGAVRTEEMINYFHYDYPQPKKEDPFSINTEMAACPWNPAHRLVLIGLQGKKIPVENLPASNIVFLIDVSGSMMTENKLPLVKSSMKLLVDQLREQDKVSLVVYAGNAGLVLPATSGANKTVLKMPLINWKQVVLPPAEQA